MRSLGFVLFLGLIACAPKNVEFKAPSGPAHPDLICPEGSWPAGAVPPAGFKAWCHRSTPTGQWLRQGTGLTWHSNGQQASHGEYVDDRPQGPWTTWHKNGQVASQGNYIEGQEHGHWARFHDTGERQGEGEMKDGKEHGAWVYWSADGDRRTEGNWQSGDKDGVWVEYDSEDRPLSERIYRSGRMTSQREL